MKELKMGKMTIEEHVFKFKMLVTKSKLSKNDAVVEYFRETLPIPLQQNIMSLSTPPTDLNEWYEWAVKLQNNFLRMKLRRHRIEEEIPPPMQTRRLRRDLEGFISTKARKTQMPWMSTP